MTSPDPTAQPLQPPDLVLRAAPSAQAELPLAAPGVQRWLWESRFGPILVEVIAGVAYVNGQAVQPFERTRPHQP